MEILTCVYATQASLTAHDEDLRQGVKAGTLVSRPDSSLRSRHCSRRAGAVLQRSRRKIAFRRFEVRPDCDYQLTLAQSMLADGLRILPHAA